MNKNVRQLTNKRELTLSYLVNIIYNLASIKNISSTIIIIVADYWIRIKKTFFFCSQSMAEY